MKRLFLASIFLILLPASLIFADVPTKHILLENLLKNTKGVPFVSWQREKYFSTGDSTFDTYPQNIVKSGNDLYIFINGSGKLFKVSSTLNGLNFKRVDSTSHFGYNIGSFAFSYNNHIYNLGGYGFWRMNGQLRIFNEKDRQWDIVKLNKEIPLITGITEGVLWYDIQEKKIYTAYYVIREEAVKAKGIDDTHFIYEVMVLDLQKNEWVKLGDLNSFLKEKLQIIKPVTMSPWGQIVMIGDKISLLDFKNNRILSLDIRKDYYQTLSRSFWGNSFYFSDSTLYYGNKDKLDSIFIRYSDFNSNNVPLYFKEKYFLSIKNKEAYIIYGIPLLLLAVSIFAFYKLRAAKVGSIKNEYILKGGNSPQTVFDEIEVQLLNLLIQNTAAGSTTSTDEQNKILGLTKKNTEIQKKQRSDIIISINRKYSFVTKVDEPIIQKQRTEFDKRAFEYFIQYSRLEELQTFLKKNVTKV
ncbi:MAG: hypothetical protein WAZ36_08330 [Sediminibacterium sp.]